MVPFNSYGASLNTAFLCLMGDFGWYSDLTLDIEPLAAGFPYFVVSMWFWSFMIFTLMILLNMIVAIIMDSYGAVTAELAAMPDSPFLWRQVSRYIHRWKQYRDGGWQPLERFLTALLQKAHPEEVVTEESMLNAFPTMKADQASFLMKWLSDDQKKQLANETADANLEQAQQAQAMMRTIADNMHILNLSILRCHVKAERVSNKRPSKSRANDSSVRTAGTADPPSDILNAKVPEQLQAQQKVLEALRKELAQQKQSSDQLEAALVGLRQIKQDQVPANQSGRSAASYLQPVRIGTPLSSLPPA